MSTNIPSEYDFHVSVFGCALDILHDRCPHHRAAYLCLQQDDFDDEICLRCWERYLFDVVNRTADKKYGKKECL